MTNEGTSGRTKRTEFTRPLSLWGSKMKNILRASLYVTHEQNLIHRAFFFGSPKEFIMGPSH